MLLGSLVGKVSGAVFRLDLYLRVCPGLLKVLDGAAILAFGFKPKRDAEGIGVILDQESFGARFDPRNP